MKCALALSLGLAACGSTSSAPPAATGPTAATPTAGQLVDTTTYDVGAMHVRIDGVGVALAQLPLVDWLGVPMVGAGTVHIDVRIPVNHGARDLHGAAGDITLECPTGCQVGDDQFRIRPRSHDPRVAALVGDGIELGHIAFDRVAIAVHLENGHAKITRWEIASPDVKLDVTADVELGAGLDDSKIDGCVRLGLDPSLPTTRPKTGAVLQTLGGPMAADGRFNVRLAGHVGELQMRAQVCDGSVPLPPVDSDPPPLAPQLPPPPDGSAAPDTTQADFDAEVAHGIKKLDDLHYEIAKDLVDHILSNPMLAAKGARLVPAVKDGKPHGFKLYAIRPTSVFGKLGFLNGDTMLAINGFELTSADKALEIYTKLRDAASLVIDLERTGKPVTLKYTIR